MSHKYIVLETNAILSRLVTISENYANAHNAGKVKGVAKKHKEYLFEQPLRPMNRERAFDWLVAYITQAVDARLMYKQAMSDLQLMQAMFDDLGMHHTQSGGYFVQDFLRVDEIDAVMVDLHMAIERHVDLHSWEQWTVVTSGNMVALVSDRDFRVCEWENLTGYLGNVSHVLELDLSNILSYLRDKLNTSIGLVEVKVEGKLRQVKPGNLIDFKPILQDAIHKVYPRITFPTTINTFMGQTAEISLADVAHDRLEAAGITDYPMFCAKYVIPVIETFGLVHMTRQLDDTDNYIATLDNRNILTVDYADSARWRRVNAEDAELEMLAESLAAGDYLPHADRRRAEEYMLRRDR